MYMYHVYILILCHLINSVNTHIMCQLPAHLW